MRRKTAGQMPVKREYLSNESLRLLGLTNRETDVLLGIARRKANKQIAASLYLSPFTVKAHLQHVYRKLAVESRTGELSRVLELLDRRG